ncbi:MAG: beta strand repeat-containing protein, partial [Limisphaerales bacterium]
MKKSAKSKTLPSTAKSWRPSLWLPIVLAALCCGSFAHAASIIKADNSDALNLGTSWTGGVAPGLSDIAVWDSTVASANNVSLGAGLTWDGIKISNPGGPVTVASDGNALTLGNAGIDMSAATVGLTLNNDVTLAAGSIQSWSVANGQMLGIGGTFARGAASQLRFDVDFNSGAAINFSGTLDSSAFRSGTAALNFSLLNGTDVGALDGSTNVAPASSVMPYYQDNQGNPYDKNFANSYLDMVNGNPSGDDADLGGSTYFSVIRFNAPEPYRNYWVYNVGGNANEVAGNSEVGTTVLVTTNVGAQDVIMEGTKNVWRWNGGGDELFLDQENTAGTLYINGVSSQRTGHGIITKFGAGRVVWNATFANSGAINVGAGEFMANNTVNSASVVTVFAGATLSGAATIPGSVTNYDGGTIHPGSTNGLGGLSFANLTLNSGSGLAFYSASAPMNNTNALLNLTGGLTVSSPINVSIIAGAPAIGQFPLIQWTNAFDGATFSDFNPTVISLRPLGAYLTNNTANQSIDLVVTSVDEPIKWSAGDGDWDINQSANWVDTMVASASYLQSNGMSDAVLFDDTASGASPITVTLNSVVSPASVTVDNASKDYIISGTGGITGGGTLTKSGAGSLTLETSNSFTGGININGGIVNFSSLDNLGSGSINFDGGALQYASGNMDDISSNTVTFNAGGGTIDDGGNTLNFANPVGNGGAGGLTKTGSGTLTLNGTNNYSSDTVVAQGTLALGASTYISNSPAIIVDNGATLDTASSGVGLTLAVGQILAGVGTVSGEVIAPAGTTLSPATNGVYGTLTLANDLVSDSTLIFDVSTTNSDLISVGGNLTLSSGTLQLNVRGILTNGIYKLIQYGGSLLSGSGSSGNLTLLGFSQPGQTAYLIDSTSGEIDLVVAAGATDNLTWG